jgi:hypothetical protein
MFHIRSTFERRRTPPEAKSEPDTDANVVADQNLESGVSDGD